MLYTSAQFGEERRCIAFPKAAKLDRLQLDLKGVINGHVALRKGSDQHDLTGVNEAYVCCY